MSRLFISISDKIISMILIKGTPETKAVQQSNSYRFDIVGLIIFMMMWSINVVITQSANFGFLRMPMMSL